MIQTRFHLRASRLVLQPSSDYGPKSVQMNTSQSNLTKSLIQLHTSAPQFGGATHLLQGRHWVSPETFQKLLNILPTPYVGQLPQALLNVVPESPKQLYQALDEMAPLLRGLKDLKKNSLTGQNGPSNQHFSLQYVDQGGYGSVYKLTINKHPYALKVFHSCDKSSTHGRFGESATALYFSNRRFSDLAQFHFGNPKAGWGVFEWISSDMPSPSRPGKSIQTVPVELGDSVGNSINGVRVDYGGIEPSRPETVPTQSLSDYQQVLKANKPLVQANAASLISSLPIEDRQEAFLMAMNTKSQDIQANAVYSIGYLPESFRKEAFLLAMNTNSSGVQTRAVSQIRYLPKEYRTEAFLLSMNTNNPEVQARSTSQIDSLPDEFQQEAFLLAMNTNNPTVQANAISYIDSLPKEYRTEAFLLAMNTNNPQIQEIAVSQIRYLPPRHQKEAFLMAIATSNPTIQACASSFIRTLPKDDQAEAGLLYFNAVKPRLSIVKNLVLS